MATHPSSSSLHPVLKVARNADAPTFGKDTIEEMEIKPQPNEDLETAEWIEKLQGVLPPEMSEVDEQCIYKVPPIIREAHPKAYTPKTISIGPFHNPRGRHANEATNIFRSMEDLKLKYLKGFLNRTGLSVEYFHSRLKEKEDNIRNCYAGGPVIYNSNDFLRIIITDACFIIELFIRCITFEKWDSDPIVSKPWLFNHIMLDMILLENQLPFFVLQDIYEYADPNSKFRSFIEITTCLFYGFNQHGINTKGLSPPKHFVDLLRIFLKPPSFDFEQKEQETNPIRCGSQCTGDFQLSFCLPKNKEEEETNQIDHVYTASQLSEEGLEFKLSEDSECLLDLKFDDNKGVLKMPCFYVDDNTELYLRNILAYEECHFPYSGYIAQYLTILDFLINTDKDVRILIEKKIIVNLLGDVRSVAKMINNLGNNVSMRYLNPNYLDLCHRLNDFYKNPRNKFKANWKQYKAILVDEYLNTPWKTASTIAAVFLLLLTLTQTIFSVWSFVKDKKTV